MLDYRMTVIALFNSRGPRNARVKKASSVLNLVDLVAKKRGLWWGCGDRTTRSYALTFNALTPTLWPCGKYKVGPLFQEQLKKSPYSSIELLSFSF
jgi:hypothetical protein